MNKKISLYLNMIFLVLDILFTTFLVKKAIAPSGTTIDIVLAVLAAVAGIMNAVDIFLYYRIWRHRE